MQSLAPSPMLMFLVRTCPPQILMFIGPAARGCLRLARQARQAHHAHRRAKLSPHTLSNFQLTIDNSQHAEGRQAEVWHHCRHQRWPQYVSPPAAHRTHRIDTLEFLEDSSEWRLTVYAEVTPRTPAARISRRKGFLSKRTAFVREITREVAGYVDLQLEVEASRMRTRRTCHHRLQPWSPRGLR